MSNERYIILNDYYIQDNQTGKKYNQKQVCEQLNLLEKIILDKTELVNKLTKTINIMEKK